MRSKIWFIFFCLLLVACSKENVYVEEDKPVETVPTSPISIKLFVTKIIDGDTFELNSGDKVRLVCVDTPEKEDYYYKEASDYLSSLVLNKEVKLVKDVSETDRYGRLLRYVYVGDKFINYELIENGYARAYRYPPDTSQCDELEEAEIKAKQNKLGIWYTKENEVTVIPVTKASSSYICTSNYYNCDDFTTHAEAQKVFDACGASDIHKLDRDKDGVVCETLS